jgi:cell division protein FtsI/penicillin-binding protein 2
LNPDAIYGGQSGLCALCRPAAHQGHWRRRANTISGAPSFSSNSYFITNGLRAGIENIVRMAGKISFRRTHRPLPTRQETAGIFPTPEVNKSDWRDGDTANICIGQGEMAVTPMQMAVAYSAIANGGTVLWPRLVERIEPQDPASGEAPTNFPSGLVRDELGVSRAV